MLLKLHGPKEDEDFKKAQSLVMTDTPSAAAKELVELICDKDKPLESCCCTKAVSALWRDMLPATVRAQVSNMGLKDASERKDTLDAADKAFAALKGPKVSAVADVAAVKGAPRGRGKGRGQQQTSRGGGNADRSATSAAAAGRGGRGRGARQARDPKDPSTWGDPHPDGSPPGACMQHYLYGKNAWICRKRRTCPWVSLANPPDDE